MSAPVVSRVASLVAWIAIVGVLGGCSNQSSDEDTTRRLSQEASLAAQLGESLRLKHHAVDKVACDRTSAKRFVCSTSERNSSKSRILVGVNAEGNWTARRDLPSSGSDFTGSETFVGCCVTNR